MPNLRACTPCWTRHTLPLLCSAQTRKPELCTSKQDAAPRIATTASPIHMLSTRQARWTHACFDASIHHIITLTYHQIASPNNPRAYTPRTSAYYLHAATFEFNCHLRTQNNKCVHSHPTITCMMCLSRVVSASLCPKASTAPPAPARPSARQSADAASISRRRDATPSASATGADTRGCTRRSSPSSPAQQQAHIKINITCPHNAEMIRVYHTVREPTGRGDTLMLCKPTDLCLTPNGMECANGAIVSTACKANHDCTPCFELHMPETFGQFSRTAAALTC
jgi:hypothetical protein